ncbi:MAG TPA: hypothetical protein VMW36_08620 [Patescibacteria group bacterium]|nr:hypothetical protein [Patescibacteria group bacterium]
MNERRRIIHNQLLIEIIQIVAMVVPWAAAWGLFVMAQYSLLPYFFLAYGIGIAAYVAFVIWRWNERRKTGWTE